MRKILFLIVILILLTISNVSAQDLKQALRTIKTKVKANPTAKYIRTHLPSDTVYVFQSGDLTIESCEGFTSFKQQGKKSLFIYDIGNNVNADRIIFTDGKVSIAEEGLMDLTGLGGTDGLDVDLSLNDMSHEMEGKTPYNTRKVYSIEDTNLVKCYNFEKNKKEVINENKGREAVKKLQSLYHNTIKELKRIF